MRDAVHQLFAEKDFFVSEKSNCARTLPIMSFWDSKFFELELETIYRKHWLCLPKKNLKEPISDSRSDSKWDVISLRGNAAKFQFLGESLLLKRGFEPQGQPKLHCFLNRCPHAFYPLLLGEVDESRNRFIQCGQHGLTAHCDGKLRSHPAFKDGMENEASALLHLREYGLADWLDLLFVHRGETKTPFEETFSPIEASLGNFLKRDFNYKKMMGERRIVDGNWKTHAWNYMDALHISWIHKGPAGLQDAVDLSSYTTELYANSSLQWAYARNEADGFDPQDIHPRFIDNSTKGRRVFALWWFVFPNLTLNFYPWGLSVNVYNPLVDDPTKTDFQWLHYVCDESKYNERETRWLSSVVDDEDVYAMRMLQNVLSSKQDPLARGIFAGETEKGPHWFHRRVYQSVFCD